MSKKGSNFRHKSTNLNKNPIKLKLTYSETVIAFICSK